MMSEKVYGFCENKCKMEVIPKDNVLTVRWGLSLGSSELTIEANETTSLTVTLPSGWDKTNTVFLGMQRYIDSGDEESNVGYTYTGNVFALDTTVGVSFTSDDKLKIVIRNNKSEQITIKGLLTFLFFKAGDILG